MTVAAVRAFVVPQGREASPGEAAGNRARERGSVPCLKLGTGGWRSAESKAAPREGGQEGGRGKDRRNESASEVATVPAKGKPAASGRARDWAWIDRSVWTERMLAALDNGVKGSKWFSLIDKVYRPQTLAGAWEEGKANKGAAGKDGGNVGGVAG